MTVIARLLRPRGRDIYIAVCAILWVLSAVASSGCSRAQQHYDIDRAEFPVKGIDLSSHNGDVDFSRLAADSITFVMLKATEGTDFCDALFARNYDNAVKAGLKVGAYHFFRFDSPGHIQAYHFLNTIAERPLDLPLAIDVEEWNNAQGTPDVQVIEELQKMVNVLEASDYRVILYTNKQGYHRYVEPTLYGRQLWICSLGSVPEEYGWRLWQHSHKGRVAGIKGDVDINTYNGSLEDFVRWLEHNN